MGVEITDVFNFFQNYEICDTSIVFVVILTRYLFGSDTYTVNFLGGDIKEIIHGCPEV